ncbi:hypothetical protein BC830DRAFT_1116476 [Chytriomyces sp. MP71]|nr:hypothetical protein BC830DRAFT_1116476 [Chytriomyces sp. MP71]
MRFHRLPKELLAIIAGYLPAGDMIRLSHATPLLKHISAAMYDARSPSMGFEVRPSLLWPNPIQNCVDGSEIAAVKRLLNVANQCGSFAIVKPASAGTFPQLLKHIPGSMPIQVSLSGIWTGSQYAHLIRALADSNLRVAFLELFKLTDFLVKLQGVNIPDVVSAIGRLGIIPCLLVDEMVAEIWYAVSKIKGVHTLDARSPRDFPTPVLLDMKSLRKVRFRLEDKVRGSLYTVLIDDLVQHLANLKSLTTIHLEVLCPVAVKMILCLTYLEGIQGDVEKSGWRVTVDRRLLKRAGFIALTSWTRET